MILFPLGLINIIFQLPQVLESKTFKDRWFNSYYDVKYLIKSALFYRVWYTLRRIVFISVSFTREEKIGIQVMTLMYCNLFTIVYHGHVLPLNTPQRNKINLANEFMIICMALTIFTFTDWVDDYDAKYLMGWVLIFLLSVVFIVNTLVIILKALYRPYLYLLKYWMRIYNFFKSIYQCILDFMYEHFWEKVKIGEHATKEVKVIKLSELVGGDTVPITPKDTIAFNVTTDRNPMLKTMQTMNSY